MEAVVLLASLITAWVLIILYVSVEYLKKRKQLIKNIDLYSFYCIIYLFDRGAGQTGNF